MPWLASCSLTSLAESLSQSLVLPKTSKATLSLGLASPLAGLEGTSMSSGPGWLELWLFPGWAPLLGSGWWIKDALTAGISFHGLRVGPFATSIIKCTVRRAVPLLVFRTNDKLEKWEPDRGASSWDVWHSRNWRRQSASLTHWTAHGGWGQRAFEFWSGVIHWGIHPWLHDSSECFTQRAYRTCTWIGSSGENPRKKPHWISLTNLGEDLHECGVHLLSHPGPLVLMIPGIPFPSEEQLPL